YEAVNRSTCNRYNSSDTLSCRLRSVAFPAQRLKIGIVISTAMSFWNDVVNACRFLRYPLTAMVLTQVFITLKDTRSFNFPESPISTLLSALTCLIVTPTITSMLLKMLVTIAADIIGYRCTSLVSTWTFSSRWHWNCPVSWIQVYWLNKCDQ
ncbi:hypothetical protein HMPREF9428_00936, partial [Citrobacter portucalensis]